MPNSRNKNLDSLSNEELLQALNKTNNDEVVTVTFVTENPVLDFINKFGITVGPNNVKVKLLWNIFKSLYPRVLTQNQFGNELSQMFTITGASVHINADAIYLHTQILKVKPKTRKNQLSSESHQRHFSAFMKTMGIGRGVHKLPPVILYHIYRVYCIEHKKKQMSLHVFSKFTEYFLDKKRGSECNYYLVNEKTANIYPQKEFNGIKEIYRKKTEIKKKPI